MWSKTINLLTIFEIYYLIRQCSAANFFTFDHKSFLDKYIRLKNSSVYPGIILSYTVEQREEMCADLLSAQLYANSETQTGEHIPRIETIRKQQTLAKEDPKYPVYLYPMIINDEPRRELCLTIVCAGQQFKERKLPPEMIYYPCSVFRSKWYLLNKVDIEDEYMYRNENYESHLVALSPDFVPFKQHELEQRFAKMLRTMNALRAESADYVELIGKKDSLSTLSRMEKLILCASILSSAIYYEDRLEFSIDWIYDTYHSGATLELEEREISLRDNKSGREKLTAECYLCKAFENASEKGSKHKNLYVTPTYDDAFSAVVLVEENGQLFVDKYFEDIAILITAPDKIDYHKLIVNYDNSVIVN